MVRAISRLQPARLIATRSHNQRAMPPENIADAAKFSGLPVQIAHTLEDAWLQAQEAAGDNDLLCITGSLYLVAEARKLIAKQTASDQERRAPA